MTPELLCRLDSGRGAAELDGMPPGWSVAEARRDGREDGRDSATDRPTAEQDGSSPTRTTEAGQFETPSDPAPSPSPAGDTEDQLTHVELETVYRDTLSTLLSSDPLLSDLPASLTAAELRSLTALEHGTAMAVLVNRGDRLTRVIVQRGATVRELKAALRGAVELELTRRGGRRRAVGWRSVWRRNWLAFRGRKLKDDDAKLEELGIGNRAEVGFVKRIRAKRGQRDKKGGQV